MFKYQVTSTKKLVAALVLLVCSSVKVDAQQLDWVRQFGASNTTWPKVLKTNADGSVFMAGAYSGILDVDPGPGVVNLNWQTDGAMFLVKLDSAGIFQWHRAFKNINIENITFDSFQNIILGCTMGDTADADPGPGYFPLYGAGYTDLCIIKLNSLGDFVWAKSIGGQGTESIYSLDTDSNDNIYFAGSFTDSVDFDPGPATFFLSQSTFNAACFASLDANGDFRFAAKAGGNSSYAMTIKVISQSNILINGILGSTFDFDPGPGVASLSSSLGLGFLLNIDTSGAFVWVKQFGGIAREMVQDNSGNILITGILGGTFDFDPGNGVFFLSSSGSNDIFILKLNSAGDFLWASSFGSTELDNGYSIVTDSLNNICISGYFRGTVDMDPGPGITNIVSPPNSGALFMALYNPAGMLIRAMQFGSTLNVNPCKLAIDQSQNIYFTCNLTGIVDFDPGPGFHFLDAGSTSDIFILKFNPDSCNNLAVTIDTVYNVSCISPGYAITSAIYGTPPYSYEWNTSPPTANATASFQQSGIYTVQVTDATGCVRNTSILVDEPLYFNQFDLQVELISGPFVPGQNTFVQLAGFNNGCTPVSGNMILVTDSLTTFVSSTPAPGLIVGDSLIWWFPTILHGDPAYVIDIILRTDTSATNADTVCLAASILPVAGDADSTNNQKFLKSRVITAYDPNDKKVYPEGLCTDKYVLINEKLTYTIRFQNTGDTTAFNVFIVDSIAASLDISTLRVTTSSHPVITQVLPGNYLKFRFDHINLPDSAATFAGSIGYIVYEIMPLSNVASGTQVKNRAHIIFDYNPPVLTNTVSNTIVQFIPIPDTSVVQNNNTLTAVAPGLSYQWLNCNNNFSIIPGANGQSYTPPVNGNYAVQINENGCIATSSCHLVTIVGLDEVPLNSFQLLPNPATSQLSLLIPDDWKETNILFRDVTGKTVYDNAFFHQNLIQIDISELAAGFYFVTAASNGITVTQRLIVIKEFE
jgi:uncharacterized repeat protein (TIGR01451 family)